MRRRGIDEEVAEVNNIAESEKTRMEKWVKFCRDGFGCIDCGTHGVYLPRSKRMICDCEDSPRPATVKVIEFYK